ncbi:MAG: hypothetical protein ACI9MC_004048, partial [Kiritimatiellia bacterium]
MNTTPPRGMAVLEHDVLRSRGWRAGRCASTWREPRPTRCMSSRSRQGTSRWSEHAEPTSSPARRDFLRPMFQLRSGRVTTGMIRQHAGPSAPESDPMLEVDHTGENAAGPVAVAMTPTRTGPSAVPWFYRLKRSFWASIIRGLIDTSAPLPLRLPRDEDLGRLKLVPLSELSKGVAPMQYIITTRHVPHDERSLAKVVLLKVVALLALPLRLGTPGLPRIQTGVSLEDLDAATAQNLGDCYPAIWDEAPAEPGAVVRKSRRLPPAAPAELRAHPEDIVGAVALAGPFAAFIRAVPDTPGRFVMDMTGLEPYPVRSGYESLGGKATLAWSSDQGRMVTICLQMPDGRIIHKPEPASAALTDPEWRRAQDIFLASVSTYMTAVTHLVGCHLKGAGEPAAAAAHTLPAAHPLRIFLHPFVHETLSTNNYKVPTLIHGDAALLPAFFALSAETVQRIAEDAAAVFDIADYDPREDARRRGMHAFAGPYPYLQDTLALWDLFEDYASKMLDHIYPTDAELEADEAVVAWLALWTQMSPSVAEYVPDLNKAAIARVLATIIFIATVVHENVGNTTWNYTVLHAWIPTRVPVDAARDTIEVQQDYMN